MRAAHIQSNVASLRLLGADERRVRDDLGAAFLARIADAARLAWLPLDVDVALTEAVHRAAGLDGVRRWSRVALRESIDAPLLRPIVKTTVSLFGLTPASLLRYMPTGWKQIYADCGALRFEVLDDHHARLHLEGAPPTMTASTAYLHGMAGSFEVAFDVSGTTGEVAHEVVSPTHVVFDIRWHAPSGAA